MRKLLLALLLLLPLSLAAQHRHIPYLGFARLDRNRIQYPSGESPDFDRFLRKMDTLVTFGQGDIRILHIGGSHVQGGTWTQQLRRNLMSLRYGLDGGRGLVFPYNAAGTNTPMGYTTRAAGEWTMTRNLKPEPSIPLGLTGLSVSTSDSSAVFFVDLTEREAREASPRFSFRTVDIFGHGSAYPVIYLDRDTLQGTFDGWKYHFDLPHYAENLFVGFRGFPGEFTLTGIYLDRPAHGLTLSECGVNGSSTRSWLDCRDLVRDLAFVRPDLVILSIGINDIQGTDFNPDRFIRNYEKILSYIHAVNPHCAILFTTNNDSYRNHVPNIHSENCQLAFARLAVLHKAALWDLFDMMGGSGSAADWENAGLMKPDRIHFTATGYDLLGNLLFNALMDAMKKTR
jgi:lysophospholipase L1-like esterase